MEVASDWGGVASFVLLLLVVVTDARVGDYPVFELPVMHR